MLAQKLFANEDSSRNTSHTFQYAYFKTHITTFSLYRGGYVQTQFIGIEEDPLKSIEPFHLKKKVYYLWKMVL